MRRKKIPVLIGVICLGLIVAVMPFVGACAEEAPPTPAPTPTPTPAPTPTPTPPAPPEKVWTLTGQTAWPAGLKLMNECHEHHINLIELYTGGQVKCEMHVAPEIVGSMELYPTVKEGGLDFGFACPCYVKGLSYAASLFCDAPGGQSPREQMCHLYLGGGLEILEELIGKHANAHPYPSVQNTSEIWMYANVPMKTVADLDGLKMRCAGSRGDVMKKLGVSVVVLGGGDIVPALEKGVIDAMEFASLYTSQYVGFTQVPKYAYFHPYKATSSFWLMIINNDIWNEFPDDIKAALADASKDNHLWSLSQGYIWELDALKSAVETDGAQLLYMPPALIEAVDTAARDHFREVAAEDAEVAMVLDSWDKFAADYGAYAPYLDIIDITSWFGMWEEGQEPWYEIKEFPVEK